jgi:hypothetical protein
MTGTLTAAAHGLDFLGGSVLIIVINCSPADVSSTSTKTPFFKELAPMIAGRSLALMPLKCKDFLFENVLVLVRVRVSARCE